MALIPPLPASLHIRLGQSGSLTLHKRCPPLEYLYLSHGRRYGLAVLALLAAGVPLVKLSTNSAPCLDHLRCPLYETQPFSRICRP